jgi:hypothetical protein
MLTELFAFVVTDPQGVEGVLRRQTPIGTQPMIADSLSRIEPLRREAIAAACELGLPLTLVRFVRYTA